MSFWALFNHGLVVLAAAGSGLLVWYLRLWLRHRVSREQFVLIQRIVMMAVQAAEQYGSNVDSKKQYAITLASEWLLTHGIRIDLNQLDAAIESSVWLAFSEDV